jgi:ribosome production factor 1
MAKKQHLTQTQKRKKTKPNPNKILKSDDTNELKAELERISESTKNRPGKDIKNKEKRRELILMRNSMKYKIKAKLRRKRQKLREEIGEDEMLEEDKIKPKTLEMLRDDDDTIVDKENNDDEEIKESIENDEYTSYFNHEYDPQILLTTSIKHTGAIFKFMRELKELIPNSFFYYRKKYDLGTIAKDAIKRGFTDIIVVGERMRKPYRMFVIHLPDGPTAEFKIFNINYRDEIENKAKNTGHNPELIFKNFKTRLGQRVTRILNSLFPSKPDLEGRQVATFHNQRDYVFFRFHRYIFSEDFDKVSLQEIGPRFCLRLLSIQKGIYDNQFGEYEHFYKNKMGVRRRKFYL